MSVHVGTPIISGWNHSPLGEHKIQNQKTRIQVPVQVPVLTSVIYLGPWENYLISLNSFVTITAQTTTIKILLHEVIYMKTAMYL